MNWKLGYRNLLRNKRRTLATAVAITMGFTGFVLATGYIVRVERFLRLSHVYLRHTGHFSIYKKDAIQNDFSKPKRDSISAEESQAVYQLLSDFPEVEKTGRFLRGTGLVSNGCRSYPFYGLGVEPSAEHYAKQHPLIVKALPEFSKLSHGKSFIHTPDIPDATNVALGLMRLLGKEKLDLDSEAPSSLEGPCDPRDRNLQFMAGTHDGSISAVDSTITGTFRTGDSSIEDLLVIFQLAHFQTLLETDRVSYIAVYLKDDKNLDSVVDRLRTKISDKQLNLQIHPWYGREISPNYVGFVGFISVLAVFIYSVLSLIVGISIVNTTTLSIVERTREISTLRAIGFQRKHIIRMFMHEMLILVFFCIGTCAVVSTSLVTAIEKANIRFSPPGVAGTIQFKLVFTAGSILLIAIAVVLLAMLSTYMAVRKKVDQDILAGFRG